MSTYRPGRLLAINYAALSGSVLSTSTPQVGDYDVTWLADPDPDLFWRTPDDTKYAAITLTPDRDRSVNAVAVCAHNLSVKATIEATLKLKGEQVAYEKRDAHRPLYGFGTEPGFGMMGFGGYGIGDIETEPLWPYTEIWFDKSYLYDELLIELRDPGNNSGYLSFNYLHVGHYWSPATTGNGAPNNFNWGYRCEFEPNSNAIDTPGGATLVDHDPPKRVMRATWRFLTEADQVRLNQLLVYAQTSGTPMFWSGYPERGKAIEQQHLLLAHPVKWTGPMDGRAGGSFELQMREVYWHG